MALDNQQILESEIIPEDLQENDLMDFEELQNQLESSLEEQLAELKGLELEHEKIGDPDVLGHIVMNVVWDQFINQVGVVAGEDFIRENRGLNLDLRSSAHIQTTENFENGKIATHNEYIDYQQRYDDWQANFQHDEKGNVLTHTTRTGKQEVTLVRGARNPFDQGRPTGSIERGTDMDHTVSAGEIIRDPEANAHLSRSEQIAFANSEANLNEMDAGQNRSKGDKSMTDWLDNPNKNGQKPNEIFDISEELDQQYREKDASAREEYAKQKKEGEERSIETGKASQKAEAARIGKSALKAVIMGLLASLVREIVGELIKWFKSGQKKLATFLESLKNAIRRFVSKLKENLLTAGDTLITTIATAIFGPIINMIKKAWIFLKQGWKSIKAAIKFLKDPANMNMPLSLKMMQVGKIVIAALTAGGAIVLGEVIEKALLTIPGFTFEIPLLGSIANLLGLFFGAVVSGIIGAIALNLIDKAISKKLREVNSQQQFEKKNEILLTQDKLLAVTEMQVSITKSNVTQNISQRHQVAAELLGETLAEISDDKHKSEQINSNNETKIDNLFNDLNNL